MQIPLGDRRSHRRVQDLEHLKAQGIVLFLPLMEKMADVEQHQPFNIFLELELRLQAAQAQDENIAVALRQKLLRAVSLLHRPRLPGLPAVDAEVGRRVSHRPRRLSSLPQRRPQGPPERFEAARVQRLSPGQRADVIGEDGLSAGGLRFLPAPGDPREFQGVCHSLTKRTALTAPRFLRLSKTRSRQLFKTPR